jgi:hypothetical protein
VVPVTRSELRDLVSEATGCGEREPGTEDQILHSSRLLCKVNYVL